MHISKLTIQAFGPFKDKVVIDFEKENIDRGLLLITGDTGAGKTTIFDAICFALYGEASGETRKTNSLRSDWAELDKETYVELEFYYNNKKYKIKRSPEYIRQSKRGNGTTKQPATAEFEINNRLETKPTEVTKEIENLIGLTNKQFHQVAMLSQGEFTKFLLADAKEKNDIFRKIFNTFIYNRIQTTLLINVSKEEEKYKIIKDKLETEKNKLKDIDINQLTTDLIENLKNLLIDKEKELNELKKILEKQNDLIKNESIKLNNIEETNKKINEYNENKINLNNLIINNPNIENEKELLNYNINIVPKIKELKTEIKKTILLINENNESINKYNDLLKDIYLENEKNKDKYKIIETYSNDIKTINNNINSIINKIKDLKLYIKSNRELESLQEKLKLIIIEYEKEINKLNNMKKIYYLNEAYIIATNMKENDSCPVCGSKTHPKLAQPIDSKITKENLDNQEKIVETITNKRKELESKIDIIKDNIKNIDIIKEESIEELENKLELLNKKQNNLEKEYKDATEIEKNINNKIIKYKENIILSEQNTKKYTLLNNNLIEELEKLYLNNNTTEKEFEENLLLEKDFLNLNEKIKKYDKLTNIYKAKLELLKDIKNEKIINSNELKDKLNNLNEIYKIESEKYNQKYSEYNRIKEIKDNIIIYNESYKKIEKDYSLIKNLSDTANGRLIGKPKITFENFVQSYYMGHVLSEANKRLFHMTDGRYTLKSKKQNTNLNDKGLDFSIFDAYTGKERDVSSLSGGEKFKASLALALGLSDVISNFAGGIKMNILFVDEGFGSLDQDSLNQALNTLQELVDNDKLVGIISHVEELINVIDKQIIVKKDTAGSIIEIKS